MREARRAEVTANHLTRLFIRELSQGLCSPGPLGHKEAEEDAEAPVLGDAWGWGKAGCAGRGWVSVCEVPTLNRKPGGPGPSAGGY